jgi:hypothetical protein
LFVVSTKFVFIWTEYSVCSNQASASAGPAAGLGADGVRNQLVLQMRGDFSLKKADGAHPPHSGGTRRGVRRPLDSHVLSGEKRGVAVLDGI